MAVPKRFRFKTKIKKTKFKKINYNTFFSDPIFFEWVLKTELPDKDKLFDFY